LPPGVPDKPDFLNEFAAAEWDRIVEKLTGYGILSDLDGVALAVYCELYSEFRATRSLRLAFPAAKFAVLRAAYTDLGLSPAARTKIPGSKKAPEKKNPFAPKPKKNGAPSCALQRVARPSRVKVSRPVPRRVRSG